MELTQAFRRIVKAGDCVFDIGAFQGETSKVFSVCTGPTGMVASFEPHPAHFFKLAMAATAAKNVLPFLRAMSNRVGHAAFFTSRDVLNDGRDQASTIVSGLATQERLGADIIGFLVESETVDHFVLAKQYVPQFIKIDVEGAEELVFQGAQATLAQFHPAIICESSFGGGVNADQTYPRMLESLGYDLFVVDVMRYREQWHGSDSRYATQTVLPIASSEFSRFSEILVNLLALPRARCGEFPITQAIDARSAAAVLL